MSVLVIDASVAAKWTLPEPDAAAAEALLRMGHDFIAPALVAAELSHVFAKKVRSREITADAARAGLRVALELIQLKTGGTAALEGALDIALKHQCSGYDATYVALALEEDCPFVTADRRLLNALLPVFPETMLWVEDVPETTEA